MGAMMGMVFNHGMILPPRPPDPMNNRTVRQVSRCVEALGFRDLWVNGDTHV
jgi:hypothetical protein